MSIPPEGMSRSDLGRMHIFNDERLSERLWREGYMLEVLTRFGGHAESSDDGKLVYVFPKLQVRPGVEQTSPC
jgi:hypothetical protein